MHDLVIRGATVVDGTGSPGFVADVAVDGAVISEVGAGVGEGREEVTAGGLVLTPGWVDIHTHYDGQVLWDPELAPSSWHGVTTTIFGNCGIGFAPAPRSAAGRERLASLIEGVEEISAEVVGRIVDWSWETFPEFLDRLAGLRLALDVGAYLPHAPLRVYAMGERGADPEAVPTDEELGRMRSQVISALEAGAFGFSTSRSSGHKTSDGDPAPSLNAGPAELGAIADGMRTVGEGVIEAIVNFAPVDSDFDVLRDLASRSGAPVSFPLVQMPHDPEGFRRVLELLKKAQGDGLRMFGQVAPRPIGVLVGLGTGRSPFRGSALFRDLEGLPAGERLSRLRQSETREAVLGELDEDAEAAFGRVADLGDPPNYFPAPEDRLAARAARVGTTAAALAYDLLVGGEGDKLLFLPAVNFADGDSEAVRVMLGDEFTVMGLSDGGAHYSRTCDASFPTYLLTRWAQSSGGEPGFSLEELVRWQTSEVAELMGLADRGVIRAGMRADLNLIDLDRLRLHPPEMRDDLPGGGLRMVQRVDGYDRTWVAGVCTQKQGTPTGELPGRLVRRGSSRNASAKTDTKRMTKR